MSLKQTLRTKILEVWIAAKMILRKTINLKLTWQEMKIVTYLQIPITF
jgi:hypothetical protein